jgi:hypothetical protein
MVLTFTLHGSHFGPAIPIGWPNRWLMRSYARWLIAAASTRGRRIGAGESDQV